MRIVIVLLVFCSIWLSACCSLPSGATRAKVKIDYSNWNFLSSNYKLADKSLEAYVGENSWAAVVDANFDYIFWFSDLDTKDTPEGKAIYIKFELRDASDKPMRSKSEMIPYTFSDENLKESEKSAPSSLLMESDDNEAKYRALIIGKKGESILKEMLCGLK